MKNVSFIVWKKLNKLFGQPNNSISNCYCYYFHYFYPSAAGLRQKDVLMSVFLPSTEIRACFASYDEWSLIFS